MVRIFPFAALRPNAEYADQVACHVGGGLQQAELLEELVQNPLSYLHVVKPGLHFGDKETQEIHYKFAGNYFRQMLEQQVLTKEDEPGIYIYRQTFPDGHVFEGLVLGISIIDYLEGSIKKHEYTLTEKEAKMVEHITHTGVVGEPVLIANPNGAYVKDWIRRHKKGDSILAFSDKAGILHEVWLESAKEGIAEIQQGFRDIDALYIADGHHRIAASSLYLTHMHNERNWPASKMCFMAYVLSDEDLWIKPFHRLVKGLDDKSLELFLAKLNARFTCVASATQVIPSSKGEFGLYTRKGWFKLSFRNVADYSTPAENLDVSRLEKYIFGEILGIKDSKTDNRLGFVRGDMRANELERMVDSGSTDAAFLLFANTMHEIKEVADAGQVMPPKSTWIEPKLLTGMLIQQF